MTRFLIEVSHDNKRDACRQAVKVFMETGSHFMTNADWGCGDDVHKAWFIVEMDSKEAVRTMLPPFFRQKARIIALQKFGPEAIDDTIAQHEE